MIAAPAALAAAILALLVACQSPGDELNSVGRASLEARVAAARNERERVIAQIRLLEFEARELSTEAERARARLGPTQLRAQQAAADLQRELTRQQMLEQDLLAAKTRAAAIEQELGPLRALEQTLAGKQGRLAELERQRQQLDQDLASRGSETAQTIALLRTRLQQLEAARTAAEQGLATAESLATSRPATQKQ